MSANNLTPLDLHHNFFEKEKSVGQNGLTFMSDVVAGTSGIGTLLLEYTGEGGREGGGEGGGREGGRQAGIKC